MTPTGWRGTQPCAGLSVVDRFMTAPLQPARWVGSRRSGWQARRTLPRLPISPVGGSTAFMAATRRGQLFSTWIRVSARPTAIRRARPTTGTSLAPAITRCSCSISSVIWNAACCVRATSILRTVGRTRWSRSWPAIGQVHAPLLPCRCRLREPGGLRVPGGRRLQVCDQAARHQILQERIAYLLKRPVGRPPSEVRRYYASFSYQAQSWKTPRRVVAKVEWHPGELYPRVGFIVTNMTRPAERVVAFYNQRGTAEQWIKEGKNAVKWTRLSCCSFAANAVRLQLHALAYNLGNFLRTLATPEVVKRWSLTSLREKLVKIGAKVVCHGRYVIFQMAEVAVPKELFQEILRLIDGLRPRPAPA